MKHAFIDNDGILTSWGYTSSNNNDQKVEVGDDFNKMPGAWRYSEGDWVALSTAVASAALEAYRLNLSKLDIGEAKSQIT
ncbi:hypothetical protein AB2664_30075 [Bacillus wiedmannii]|uniref:hypothetical protein n=1 Tax=Bacillus wiedmannii TaxID=1890302 RepID=UPI003464789D